MKNTFDTLTLWLAIFGVLLAAGGSGRAEPELAANSPPVERLERVPPLAPEPLRQAIQALPGFRVELVAAEPLLRSPIAIDFDEDGRMYVAEYAEYNDYAATRPQGHGSFAGWKTATATATMSTRSCSRKTCPSPAACCATAAACSSPRRPTCSISSAM